MSQLAYVNHRFVPHREARVHIDDRGYQFADSVYEVIPVHHGVLVDETPHFERFDRSLSELAMGSPMERMSMRLLARELLRRNGVTSGFIYLQVSRGVARRDHRFPDAATKPALVMTTRHLPPPSRDLPPGVRVVSAPDLRWKRCDIKSTALLANVLGKQSAVVAGAYEAWLTDEKGNVTEGSSTNAWIVTHDKTVITRQADHAILNGITRQSLISVIKKNGYEFEEKPFSLSEAKRSVEAFLTSSTSFVIPVIRIDDTEVCDGRPGPLSAALRRHYIDYVSSLEDELAPATTKRAAV